MNKKLPFEDAFERRMNNLPNEHEDESWQKMKKLLDDNEKRRPLAFLKTSKVWSLFILLLLMGVWFIICPAHSVKEKPVATLENKALLQPKINTHHLPKVVNKTQTLKPAVSDAINKTVNNQSHHSAQIASVVSDTKTMSRRETKTSTARERRALVVKKVFGENRSKQNNLSANKQSTGKETSAAGIKGNVVSTKGNPVNSSKAIPPLHPNKESADTTFILKPGQDNTLITKHNDLSTHKEDAAAKENTASEKAALHKLKKYFVNAGIGVQQQIPVANHQVVHYGYNGNNNLSDYIPSLYLRFEREQKWFLQGEFIYGAPQLLKKLAYSRQTNSDSSGAVTTTTLHLKKTFYNDIPVSFNYYLRPDLSAGIGVAYSWFHGAIAEKEINTHNSLTQTNSLVQQVVPIGGYTDSFLYKSHTYLFLQTDYQWRRLSLSLRYTKDVQPFIKYTLPNGAVENQKNWSLQFMLRFRVWKSAQF